MSSYDVVASFAENGPDGSSKGVEIMANTKVLVQVQNSSVLDSDTIVLSDSFVRRQKIPTNHSLALKFGAIRQTVRVISTTQPGVLRMGQQLAQRLGLHQGLSLGIRYKSAGGLLILGPLIGVLMTSMNTSSSQPFRDSTAFCRELTDACRLQGGHVYFFTPKSIGSGTTVSGLTYAGGWRRGVFPVPDVVYNRLTKRKLENKLSVQHFLKEVKSRHGGSVFNERYLDKTDAFRALKNDPASKKYLPESYAFTGLSQLQKMLGRYPTVYIKPIYGSLGKGIVRFAREGSSIAVHSSAMNGTIRKSYSTLPLAYSSIAGTLRKGKFQIQQGIRLIKAGGRPIDFRALVQRDRSGEWTVTSIVGRIAGGNHFVSNLARGGTLTTAKDALAKSGLRSKKSALEGLRKAAIDIAQGIEAQVKGHYAELGIDLAVDSNGRVWLLEVNTKPSKNDNTQLVEGKIRPSVKMTVQYAHHLAGL
jgi:glutathione synthase/RimK-type ligase-like ATP-grasp enzyme